MIRVLKLVPARASGKEEVEGSKKPQRGGLFIAKRSRISISFVFQQRVPRVAEKQKERTLLVRPTPSLDEV
jgi:hypothetical protein